MDLGTIDRKLIATTINKIDSIDGASSGYRSVAEWIQDVRYIFQNTYNFNGMEHDVSKFAQKLEEVFDKQLKKMPTGDEEPPETVSTPYSH